MRHDADQSLQQPAAAVKGRAHFRRHIASLQVGSEVARRARGLGLTVIAYDPYASEEKARAQVAGRQCVTAAAALDWLELWHWLRSKCQGGSRMQRADLHQPLSTACRV